MQFACHIPIGITQRVQGAVTVISCVRQPRAKSLKGEQPNLLFANYNPAPASSAIIRVSSPRERLLLLVLPSCPLPSQPCMRTTAYFVLCRLHACISLFIQDGFNRPPLYSHYGRNVRQIVLVLPCRLPVIRRVGVIFHLY